MQQKAVVCDCDVIHSDVVSHIKNESEDSDTLFDVSDFFKVMSDSTRMRILYSLDLHELCVCDLSVLLNMTKSAVSHQLKVLKDAELVKYRRDGKNVFYSLKDDHVKTIIEMGIEHIKEKEDDCNDR